MLACLLVCSYARSDARLQWQNSVVYILHTVLYTLLLLPNGILDTISFTSRSVLSAAWFLVDGKVKLNVATSRVIVCELDAKEKRPKG